VKYVLPNSIQQTIIGACMGIGGTISAISGLSFLGLGVQPPLPEWGAMLNDGRNYLRYYPNMLLAPCIMIALTILSISLFGDGLRDAMDPRMKDLGVFYEREYGKRSEDRGKARTPPRYAWRQRAPRRGP